VPSLLSTPKANNQNLLLMLLTPADFGSDWQLPGFKADEQDGVRVWRGSLNGVDLVLHSAVLGKAVREGGWDLMNQRPRPVKSLMPAGSVYFCTVEGDPQAAIDALHGLHIGHDTALGRGELAVGSWR
jgi:CRISPR-associated protein Cmr3